MQKNLILTSKLNITAALVKSDLYFHLSLVLCPPTKNKIFMLIAVVNSILYFLKFFFKTSTQQYECQTDKIHPPIQKKAVFFKWPSNQALFPQYLRRFFALNKTGLNTPALDRTSTFSYFRNEVHWHNWRCGRWKEWK